MDRLTPQLRIIPLFDGSVEGVHIDMDAFASGHLAELLLEAHTPFDCASLFTRFRLMNLGG